MIHMSIGLYFLEFDYQFCFYYLYSSSSWFIQFNRIWDPICCSLIYRSRSFLVLNFELEDSNFGRRIFIQDVLDPFGSYKTFSHIIWLFWANWIPEHMIYKGPPTPYFAICELLRESRPYNVVSVIFCLETTL